MKGCTTMVFVRLQFEALHRWPDCPVTSDVFFLRNLHRHIFHVEMGWKVQQVREIEFIEQKNKVLRFIRGEWEGRNLRRMSCEKIAHILLEKFGCTYVSVSEDGENGAIVSID